MLNLNFLLQNRIHDELFGIWNLSADSRFESLEFAPLEFGI
jgi:hypothetical protein